MSDNLIIHPGGNIDLYHHMLIGDDVLIVMRFSEVRRWRHIPKWLAAKRVWLPIAIQASQKQIDDIAISKITSDNNRPH